jgi:uncharacterized Tic20 family protein
VSDYEAGETGGAAPPGWYPVDQTTQRYWDGTQWTSATAPLGSAAEPVTQQAAAVAGAVTKSDRNMAALAHLSGLIAGLFSVFGFIGPLVVWLVARDRSPFIDDQGKEALNFQLTLLLLWLAVFVSIFLFIGLLLVPILWLFSIVASIIGAIKASQGEAFRYPLTIRFI